jgi:hypothetical protein
MLAHGVSGLRAAAARRRSGSQAGPCTPRCEASADPERELRKLPFLNRPLTGEGRRRALLGELAMLNERLSGGKPHEVRQRVEWIALRRRNWELITDYVTRTDAAVTLSLIEAANAKASCTLYISRRPALERGLGRLWRAPERVGSAARRVRSRFRGRRGACAAPDARRVLPTGEGAAFRGCARVRQRRRPGDAAGDAAEPGGGGAGARRRHGTRPAAAEAAALCSSRLAAHARTPPPRPSPRRKRA